MKKIISFLLAMLVFYSLSINFNKVEAASSTSNLVMVIDSGCYSYTAKSSKSSNRADYLTFGEEVNVISISGDWATINNDGKIQYILTKNIDYKKASVIKNRIMVSKGAYACSTKSTLGYLFYGTDVSIIEEVVGKNGTTYAHVLIEKTFEADGKTIKNETVEGYINKIYLEDKNIPKIIDVTTNLYSSAFGKSASDKEKTPVGKIYMGEQVQVLMSNTTWSKILFNNETFFVYTDKLKDLQLQILVNRVIQTFDAKPGSGSLHYVYWNTPITVLNEYHSDIYGKYYYCKISGDYGFIREFSNTGIQYVGYQNTMIATNSMNLYEYPDSKLNKIMKIDTGSSLIVMHQNDTWSHVNYNGTEGYVLTDKLGYLEMDADGDYYKTSYRLYKNLSNGTIHDRVQLIAKKEKYDYAYILSNNQYYWMKLSALKALEPEIMYTTRPFTTLHVSAQSASDSFMIPYMSEIKYLGTASQSATGSWNKVSYEDDIYYLWMNKDETYLTKNKHTLNYETNTEIQKEIIEKALYIYHNWDTKYEKGQSNGIMDSDGKYGFDCSGFASYVLDSVMLNHVPTYNVSSKIETLYNTESIYNKGYDGELISSFVLQDELNISELEAGDIIYFDTDLDEEVDHCGVYLGNSEFMHSSSSWEGKITIMPLTHFYEETFVAAKRYLPDKVTSAKKVMMTTSNITNIYSEKSDDSDRITSLGKNEDIILHFTDNGNWAYIEYEDNKFGFVLTKYLK